MESRMRSAKDSAENPPNYKTKISFLNLLQTQLFFMTAETENNMPLTIKPIMVFHLEEVFPAPLHRMGDP